MEAFKAVTDINDSFDTVKSKLLAWDKDMHESRKKTAKLIFNRATHESGETLFLYSSRLEKLFNLAYPKHKSVEKNSLLIDHYIETLPSYAKQDFTATQRYKRLTGEEMTWSVVQKLARLKDAELKDKKVEESKVEEIVINVQKSKQPDNQQKTNCNHVQYDQQNKQFNFQNQGNVSNHPNPRMNYAQNPRGFRPQQQQQFFNQGPRGFRPQHQQQNTYFNQDPRQFFNPLSAPQNFQWNRFSAPPNFNNFSISIQPAFFCSKSAKFKIL